jgi:hypothetical protein
MRTFTGIVAMLLWTLAVGCQGPAKPDLTNLAAQGRGILPQSGDPNDPNVQHVLLIQLGVGVIEAPVGTISGSEELWSYLDEEPVRSLGAASLGRNGLRIGVGQEGTWPELARILKEMTGQAMSKKVSLFEPGAVVEVRLKEDQPAQTVFISYSDRTLSGLDLPAGHQVLAMTFTIDSDHRDRLLVTAVPQVRSVERRPRLIKEVDRYVIAEKPDIVTFLPLTFQISLKANSFIVVGPNAAARRPSSLGHSFFLHTKDGIEMEQVFVLTPEVISRAVQ